MKIQTLAFTALVALCCNTLAMSNNVSDAINQVTGHPSAAIDSTKLMPNKTTVVSRRSESYVDTNNCVETQKSIFVVVAGIGGGKLDQSCPADHPVMYEWKQTVAYTTAVPWSGAVMGAGGDNRVKCCATSTRWVDTNSSQPA